MPLIHSCQRLSPFIYLDCVLHAPSLNHWCTTTDRITARVLCIWHVGRPSSCMPRANCAAIIANCGTKRSPLLRRNNWNLTDLANERKSNNFHVRILVLGSEGSADEVACSRSMQNADEIMMDSCFCLGCIVRLRSHRLCVSRVFGNWMAAHSLSSAGYKCPTLNPITPPPP